MTPSCFYNTNAALAAARSYRKLYLPVLVLVAALLLAGCGGAGAPQTEGTATRSAAAGSGTPILQGSALPSSGSSTPGLVPEVGGQITMPLALSDLHMISPNEGWAMGWTADRSAGGILRTSDGGAHWVNVSPSGIDPTQIETTFFLDADHAWVLPSAATPDSGNVIILSTRDGGQTWQRSEPLHFTSAGPGWLDFIDRDHGWLMANLGASAGAMAVGVYRTTDGGRHWETASVTAGEPSLSTPGSLPLECNKTGLSFVNSTTGWATGHCTTGGVFFFQTRDGGRSWQPQPIQPPADLPSGLFQTCDCETNPPGFASKQNGVTPVKIFTTQHEAVLYVTRDGGQTWKPSQLSTNQLLRPPDFVTPVDGWVTDERQIFATHDGGQTWAVIAQLPDLRLLGTFDFVDQHDGWVTGGELVYRTTDGGRSWAKVTPLLMQSQPRTQTP